MTDYFSNRTIFLVMIVCQYIAQLLILYNTWEDRIRIFIHVMTIILIDFQFTKLYRYPLASVVHFFYGTLAIDIILNTVALAFGLRACRVH